MLNELMRWNRWGGATLSGGIARQITPKIYPFIDTPDVVVLIGLRRAGKTTVLFQVMDYLESKNIPQEAMLHINFEEPALGASLSIALLDEIYNEYRKKIFPKGKAYLFLDEIQNVPQWERWVRARNESEDIKIFLTGSSAHLMSRELGTVLTGRHISLTVNPLCFSEFLFFNKIKIPKIKNIAQASHEVRHALEKYLYWGALPEVVLSGSDERREYLLKQYLDDLLFKDVSMRHEVRDITLLRNCAVYLLTQTASLVSYNRIAKQFDISLDKAIAYCGFLQEAFLVDFLPFFSLKAAKRNRQPFKVHAVDLGLRRIAALSGSEDVGRLMETAVYHQLKIKWKGNIYYWKGKHEIDFLLREGNSVTQLIQVSQKLTDEKTIDREQNALTEAKLKFNKAETHIIADIFSKELGDEVEPFWSFLLG